MVFKLSASLKGHDDDVRGVVFASPNDIVSVSRDATVRIWRRPEAASTEFDGHINSTGSAFINSVTYVQPTTEHPKGLIVSGGQETIIEVREPESSSPDADYLLLGHTHNVCALDTFGDTVVSGAWDGTARIWKNWETKHVLEGHEGAVWAVLALSESDVVTGGADKTIRLWRNGKQVSVIRGHTDCVRGLCRLPDGLFASCANDATIRVWRPDGRELHQLHGHTSFIYSIAALPSGEIISGGEDRTLRIWRGEDCVQTITHPAISVWSVSACSKTGDIVSGASDRIVRVFSRNEKSWASSDALSEFEQSVASSSIPANQVGDVKKDELPGLEALQTAGTKDGKVVMVRNGDKVEAHMWSASTNSWSIVGTVVDAVGSGRKRTHDGKEYDYVFDVDITEGAPPLKLPYNASENPFEAARRFLENNELPMSYLDQVGNFIVQNTGGVALGQQENTAVDPWGSAAHRYVPGQSEDTPAPSSRPKFLPHNEYLTITAANLAVVQKKLGEFNQNMLSGGRKDLSLNPDDLSVIGSLCEVLQAGKPARSPKIDTGVEALLKVITTWPAQQRLPALDLLRLLTAISPVPAECSVDGADLVTILKDSGSASVEHINNVMLVTRAFVNIFQTEPGKKFAAARYGEILGLVSGAAANSSNRNLEVAEATLLLNYSVLFRAENSVDKAITMLERLLKLISTKTDPETVFRSLVALGNLLTIDSSMKEAAAIYDAKPGVRSAVSKVKDTRISQISEDLALLM